MQRNLMEILQSQMNEVFGYVGVIDSGFDDVEEIELPDADEDEVIYAQGD